MMDEFKSILGSIVKIMECVICLHIPHDPVSVGCGHFFCRECITMVLKQNFRAACPLCTKSYTKRSIQEASQRKSISNAVRMVIATVENLLGVDIQSSGPEFRSLLTNALKKTEFEETSRNEVDGCIRKRKLENDVQKNEDNVLQNDLEGNKSDMLGSSTSNDVEVELEGCSSSSVKKQCISQLNLIETNEENRVDSCTSILLNKTETDARTSKRKHQQSMGHHILKELNEKCVKNANSPNAHVKRSAVNESKNIEMEAVKSDLCHVSTTDAKHTNAQKSSSGALTVGDVASQKQETDLKRSGFMKSNLCSSKRDKHNTLSAEKSLNNDSHVFTSSPKSLTGSLLQTRRKRKLFKISKSKIHKFMQMRKRKKSHTSYADINCEDTCNAPVSNEIFPAVAKEHECTANVTMQKHDDLSAVHSEEQLNDAREQKRNSNISDKQFLNGCNEPSSSKKLQNDASSYCQPECQVHISKHNGANKLLDDKTGDEHLSQSISEIEEIATPVTSKDQEYCNSSDKQHNKCSDVPCNISMEEGVNSKDQVDDSKHLICRSPGWSRIRQMNKDFHLRSFPLLHIQKSKKLSESEEKSIQRKNEEEGSAHMDVENALFSESVETSCADKLSPKELLTHCNEANTCEKSAQFSVAHEDPYNHKQTFDLEFIDRNGEASYINSAEHQRGQHKLLNTVDSDTGIVMPDKVCNEKTNEKFINQAEINNMHKPLLLTPNHNMPKSVEKNLIVIKQSECNSQNHRNAFLSHDFMKGKMVETSALQMQNMDINLPENPESNTSNKYNFENLEKRSAVTRMEGNNPKYISSFDNMDYINYDNDANNANKVLEGATEPFDPVEFMESTEDENDNLFVQCKKSRKGKSIEKIFSERSSSSKLKKRCSFNHKKNEKSSYSTSNMSAQSSKPCFERSVEKIQNTSDCRIFSLKNKEEENCCECGKKNEIQNSLLAFQNHPACKMHTTVELCNAQCCRNQLRNSKCMKLPSDFKEVNQVNVCTGSLISVNKSALISRNAGHCDASASKADSLGKTKVIKRVCLTLDEIQSHFKNSDHSGETEVITSVPLPFSDFILQLTVFDETLNVSVLRVVNQHPVTDISNAAHDSSLFHSSKNVFEERNINECFNAMETGVTDNSVSHVPYQAPMTDEVQVASKSNLMYDSENLLSDTGIAEQPDKVNYTKEPDNEVKEPDNEVLSSYNTCISAAHRVGYGNQEVTVEQNSVSSKNHDNVIAPYGEQSKPLFASCSLYVKKDNEDSSVECTHDKIKPDSAEASDVRNPELPASDDGKSDKVDKNISVIDGKYQNSISSNEKNDTVLISPTCNSDSASKTKLVYKNAHQGAFSELQSSRGDGQVLAFINSEVRKNNSVSSESCGKNAVLDALSLKVCPDSSKDEIFSEEIDPFADTHEFCKSTPTAQPSEAEFEELIKESESYSSDPDMVFATDLVAPLKDVARSIEMKMKCHNDSKQQLFYQKESGVKSLGHGKKDFQNVVCQRNSDFSENSKHISCSKRANKFRRITKMCSSEDSDEDDIPTQPIRPRRETLKNQAETPQLPRHKGYNLTSNQTQQNDFSNEEIGSVSRSMISSSEDVHTAAVDKMRMEIKQMNEQIEMLEERMRAEGETDMSDDSSIVSEKFEEEKFRKLKTLSCHDIDEFELHSDDSKESTDLFTEPIPPTPPNRRSETKCVKKTQ